MAAEKFWNDIINEVQLMSEEEFSDFVDECEKTPEILLTSFGNNIYDYLCIKRKEVDNKDITCSN